ncbi:MAG TPA: DUF2298 domain-containing protein, partial [Chloroflexota bacterium]|nr:DUF2298 domain-containing protein [Chloroflexota bacterium]
MAQALWWWLVVQVVALCALPLSLTLFAPLADRGYGLAKAFGLLLFAYLVWLLASTPLLSNVPLLLGLALLLMGGGSALVLLRGGGSNRLAELLAFWRRRRGLLLLEEVIFLGAFLGFLALRAYSPEIAGTEKFMDFAFLNAVTRSAHFPPLDPWLAPSPALPGPTINYYYFGYLIQALLLELVNIIPGAVHPAVGFNLALGLLFALTALGAFSLGYGLARDLVAEGTVARSRPATAPPAGPPAGAATPASRGPARSPTWSLRAAWPYVATGLLTAFLLLVAGNLWTALRLVDGSKMWSRDFWQGIGWNATRVLVIKEGER